LSFLGLDPQREAAFDAREARREGLSLRPLTISLGGFDPFKVSLPADASRQALQAGDQGQTLV